MTATLLHLTEDGAHLALAFGLISIFVLLGFCALGMWLEEHAPERDEDEELDDHYATLRRLPL